ncbi:MAG: hypothetical protein Q8N99_05665 [Nanoarchaeota archaeon]|nr:hypothetical protein [Nanoarchaeota archaeon]
MGKSIIRIIISQIIGFLIFLILLAIANYFSNNLNIKMFSDIVAFLNSNLMFLVFLTIIGLTNEIFWNLIFPINLIAPITSSVFTIYILLFFKRLLDFLIEYENLAINIPIEQLFFPITLIVLISGYIIILVRHNKSTNIEDRSGTKFPDKKKEIIRKEIKRLNRDLKEISWNDVGDEFKDALYKLGNRINNFLDEDKKSKKKKK